MDLSGCPWRISSTISCSRLLKASVNRLGKRGWPGWAGASAISSTVSMAPPGARPKTGDKGAMEDKPGPQQGMAAAGPGQAGKGGGEAPALASGQALPGGIVEDLS